MQKEKNKFHDMLDDKKLVPNTINGNNLVSQVSNTSYTHECHHKYQEKKNNKTSEENKLICEQYYLSWRVFFFFFFEKYLDVF